MLRTALKRSDDNLSEKLGTPEAQQADLSDFAKFTPFAVSDLEFIPQNNDLVMDGPFAEPDSYFLCRQARSYGEK